MQEGYSQSPGQPFWRALKAARENKRELATHLTVYMCLRECVCECARVHKTALQPLLSPCSSGLQNPSLVNSPLRGPFLWLEESGRPCLFPTTVWVESAWANGIRIL